MYEVPPTKGTAVPPRPAPRAADEVADANLHHVATAELAVDGKVEQSPIAQPALTIEIDLIAQTCCGLNAFGKGRVVF